MTTVRSQEKGQKILDAHQDAGNRLQVVIVPDMASVGAFDEAVRVPGTEVVMHVASPCTLTYTDAQKDIIEPALTGTNSLLRSIHRDAPQVRRVILTSSISAMLDVRNPATTFSEQTWNPADPADIHLSKGMAYMIAKTLTERAAWDYVRVEKPPFDLVTVNPPLVLGPLMRHLATADSISLSNAALADAIRGQWKEEIPPAGPVNLWVDVRDVAAAHLAAMERGDASGKRLFTVGGRFSNAEIARILRDGAYSFHERLPGQEVKGDEGVKGISYSSEETDKLLAIDWIPLEKTIADFVKSIQDVDLK